MLPLSLAYFDWLKLKDYHDPFPSKPFHTILNHRGGRNLPCRLLCPCKRQGYPACRITLSLILHLSRCDVKHYLWYFLYLPHDTVFVFPLGKSDSSTVYMTLDLLLFLDRYESFSILSYKSLLSFTFSRFHPCPTHVGSLVVFHNPVLQ